MKEEQNRGRRRSNLSSINSDRINLDKCKENVIFFLAGELGLLLLNILCYGDMYWMILEQVLMVPCFKILKERKKKKEQQLYQKGFQDLLQSLLTSLQTGYSDLHIALEQLFMDFADSTNLEEARQFAVVIEIVQSTGGNVVEILKRTMQHLKYKMDTEEEIRVLLSGKLFEKNIMLSMPFFILVYLRLANPEYVACFYKSAVGHLVMSAMIGITVACFFWSDKIMDIQF